VLASTSIYRLIYKFREVILDEISEKA